MSIFNTGTRGGTRLVTIEFMAIHLNNIMPHDFFLKLAKSCSSTNQLIGIKEILEKKLGKQEGKRRTERVKILHLGYGVDGEVVCRQEQESIFDLFRLDVIEINLLTTNWVNGTLLEICDQS
ncbi:hypothetical protein ACJX0J_035167 [Zea mays]